MAQMIRLTCPECGNTMDVPAELEEFSCLYCGKRARTAAVKALNENAEATYAQLRAEKRLLLLRLGRALSAFKIFDEASLLCNSIGHYHTIIPRLCKHEDKTNL